MIGSKKLTFLAAIGLCTALGTIACSDDGYDGPNKECPDGGGECDECSDGSCTIESECEPECESWQSCVKGVCEDNACEPECESWQSCVKGVCEDSACEPECESWQSCVKGVCEDNACEPACIEGQSCVKGVCEDNACEPACIEGQECVKGVCTPELCGDQICGETQACFNAVCYEKNEFCGSEVCSSAQKCVDDQCVAFDACDSTACPEGHSCVLSSNHLPICYTNACADDEFYKTCADGTLCVNGSCMTGSFEPAQACDGGYLDEHGKCTVPLKSISLVAAGIETGSVDVLLNSDESFRVVYSPENTTQKDVTWKMKNVTAGAKNESVSDLVKTTGEDSNVLTMKGVSVFAGDIELTVVSAVNPEISANTKVLVKPYFAIRKGDIYDDYKTFHKGDLSCNKYDERNVAVFNRDLYEKYVKPKMIAREENGSTVYYPTRASVVAAARFISMQFPYWFPYILTSLSISHYVWASDSLKSNEDDARIYGLRLTSNSYGDHNSTKVNATKITPWACTKSDKKYGFECSGLVTWAFRNGRFHLGDWKTDIFTGGPAGKGNYLTQKDNAESSWGWNTNNRYDKVKEKFAKLAKSDFIKVADCKPEQIHAGDLLWWNDGHVAIVVGVKHPKDNPNKVEYVYVAEATTHTETHNGGNVMTRYSWSKFLKSKWIDGAGKGKTGYLIRMDNVYSYYSEKYNLEQSTNAYDDFWDE